VFDRYDIVSDQDLKDAASKQQAYLQNQGSSENYELRGHVIEF